MLILASLLAVMTIQQGKPLVLFGGEGTTEWVHRDTGEPCAWKVEKGELVVTDGKPDLITKRKFRDYRLHLEFWLPLMPNRTSQARANSGVYNHGRYEIQILDSFNNATYAFAGCGAIYGQKDPDAFALQPPETWNRYDIVFRAPRFDNAGKEVEKPRISVWHNGIRIHHDVTIRDCPTAAGIPGPPVSEGPIMLQNHGSPVRFRNIWILELRGATRGFEGLDWSDWSATAQRCSTKR